MSFSFFFYASLAPKEDSYKYESRTVFTLCRYKMSSSWMSVSFCNENPNKHTQKWLVSNKFLLLYHVATGMSSFLNETHSDIM